jgi:hypothetical protein
LKAAWANIWDGVRGTTGATSKLPADIKDAASLLVTTATNGETNAGLAQDAADLADTKAVAADALATLISAANNIVTDPDFTDTTIRRGTAGFTPVYQSAVAQGGNALQLTALSTNPRHSILAVKPDGNPLRYPVTGGMVFGFEIGMQAKSTNSGTGNLEVYFILYDVAGIGYGSAAVAASVALSKGTWQRLAGTYTIPTFITGSIRPYTMVVAVGTPSCSVGDIFYLDRAFVYR